MIARIQISTAAVCCAEKRHPPAADDQPEHRACQAGLFRDER